MSYQQTIFNIHVSTAINILNQNGIAAKEHGHKIAVICPFHLDSDFGNAFINPNDNYKFRCFRCHTQSNIAGAIKKRLGITYKQALDILQIEQPVGLESFLYKPIELLNPEKKSYQQKSTISLDYIKAVSINFDPQDYYYTRLKYYDLAFIRQYNVRKVHTGYYKILKKNLINKKVQ